MRLMETSGSGSSLEGLDIGEAAVRAMRDATKMNLILWRIDVR